MKRFFLLLAGLLVSLAVGACVFVGLSALVIKLTKPHTPLVLFAGLLAIGSVIVANVLWQERFVPPRPRDLYSTSKYR